VLTVDLLALAAGIEDPLQGGLEGEMGAEHDRVAQLQHAFILQGQHRAEYVAAVAHHQHILGT
jgi:hypothetical protein